MQRLATKIAGKNTTLRRDMQQEYKIGYGWEEEQSLSEIKGGHSNAVPVRFEFWNVRWCLLLLADGTPDRVDGLEGGQVAVRPGMFHRFGVIEIGAGKSDVALIGLHAVIR